MPKVNIWVRKEDLVVYKQIEDFPEWLHNNFQQQLLDWQGEHKNEKRQL